MQLTYACDKLSKLRVHFVVFELRASGLKNLSSAIFRTMNLTYKKTSKNFPY